MFAAHSIMPSLYMDSTGYSPFSEASTITDLWPEKQGISAFQRGKTMSLAGRKHTI
jgi:hypothetical protein